MTTADTLALESMSANAVSDNHPIVPCRCDTQVAIPKAYDAENEGYDCEGHDG
jgi:hypothetical protein